MVAALLLFCYIKVDLTKYENYFRVLHYKKISNSSFPSELETSTAFLVIITDYVNQDVLNQRCLYCQAVYTKFY